VAQPSVVCDTSVLLYLGRIDHLFLLPRLFAEIAIPAAVANELDVGRSVRADTVDARQLEWATLVTVTAAHTAALPANRLGAGERAVRVRYLVIGEIAAVLHGVPRATCDLDILIEATTDNADRLLHAVLEAGLGTATRIGRSRL
jgi:hypothetical protein